MLQPPTSPLGVSVGTLVTVEEIRGHIWCWEGKTLL